MKNIINNFVVYYNVIPKLRLISILLTLVTSFEVSFSQVPNYVWTKVPDANSTNVIHEIEKDIENNLYSVGGYNSTLDFDLGYNTSSSSSVGNTDAFIMKTNLNGELIWGYSYGDTESEFFIDVEIVNPDEIYLVGNFYNYTSFNVNGVNEQITSSGGFDSFIIKINSSGQILWYKVWGGQGTDGVVSVEKDSLGNIYVGGNFEDTIDLDPSNTTSDLKTSSGSFDFYLLKLDSDGNYLWGNSFGGSASDRIMDMTTDNSENLCVSGMFNNGIDFDPGSSTVNLNTNGEWDCFILKLNSNGQYIWAKSFGGSNGERADGITCDPWNNIIVTGRFYTTADFDPGNSVANLTSSVGSDDMYILKLDSLGNFNWVYSTQGPSTEGGTDVISDSDGNVYVIGGGSPPFYHSYALKMDSTGNLLWNRTILSSTGISIKLLGQKLIYLTGTYCGSVNFNYSGSPGSPDNQYTQSTHFFLQKLNECEPSINEISVTTCDNYISPSGKYTWVNNGIYVDTVLNNELCDSIITIHLTINNSNYSIDQYTVCDSLVWIDGNTYYSNNTSAHWFLQNNVGCDSIVFLNLTVHSAATNVNVIDDIVIQAELNNAAYQWVNCDNLFEEIVGESNQFFLVQENGTYAVLTSLNGCIDTSECIYINNLELTDQNSQSFVHFHPNPLENLLIIETDYGLENPELELFDTSGKSILKQELNKYGPTEIQIKCSPGIYFIKVYSSNQTQSFKILKL